MYSTGLLFLSLLSLCSAARPSFSSKNATAWRTPGACAEKIDCPTYFDCFNPSTDMLVDTSPLEGGDGGLCECYGLLGKSGDDCTVRGGLSWVMMLFFLSIVISCGVTTARCVKVLVTLKKAGALDLKKPGNRCLALMLPVGGGVTTYQFCLFLANVNADPAAFFVDSLRLLAVVISVLFLQLSNLQIATTWITIGGTAGKKNAQFADYPPKIKLSLRICTFLKGLSVVVVAVSIITGNIQLLRFFTFVQFIGISVFYWFGANILYKVLAPKGQGDTESDEAYQKKCEPADMIKKTGHKCCFCSLGYILLGGASNSFLVSIDPMKAVIGGALFVTSLMCAVYLVHLWIEYCKFGVRKILAKSSSSKVAASTVTVISAASNSEK